MKTVTVTRFDRGMADDKYNAGSGEYVLAKQFDTQTNPKRLQPLRGMTAHTANTGIGNLIVASDGLMYGPGIDLANTPAGKLWVMPGYGATDDFRAESTNQLSGAAINYDFVVDWPDAGNARKIHWASANLLVASVYDGSAGSASTQALTFTTIGQGLVHPKDKNLYIPYRTSTTPYIALLQPNAAAFGSFNATAFTLPLQYRVYCLTYYGNYLAIPATGVTATALADSSIVYLSNRDTSLTTFEESIPWGAGSLKVLKNLQGVLVGVSELTSDVIQAGTAQDYNAIHIKVWEGGAEPTLIKELKAIHLAGSNAPSVSINPRVNFIQNNRLYFSVNINPNDGIQTAMYGLFSVGRNKTTGEWTVNLERMATVDGSETGVIAASIVGDYVEMVHTAAGTLSKTINGATSGSTYAATSIHETVVNPEMEENDLIRKKQLKTFSVFYEPLTTAGQVVAKYRVDSTGAWTTIFTETTNGVAFTERTQDASDTGFTSGRNYEFRIESTGGAVIVGYSYKYENLETNV